MNAESEKDNRRIARFSLGLPVRIESRGTDGDGWNEITRLNDVSAFGAGFDLRRSVKAGRLVQMTMPLPRKLRCFDFTEPQYKVWGLVRSCVTKENSPPNDSNHAVGVAFIGKRPPQSYLDDPAKIFEISHCADGNLWSLVEAPTAADKVSPSEDRRRHSRLAIPANVIIEKIDAEGNVTASEPTVTENLSLSGAAIFTTLAVETGEFVRIKSEQYAVSIISVVRGKRSGQDGIPRLHIEFVDRFFPLEGIE